MSNQITNDQATALAKVHGLPDELVKGTSAVEDIVSRTSSEDVAKLPSMAQTIVLSKGMHDLRKAMNQKLVETVFMPLQGTKLGFRTDKDKDGGYPWDVVRDVLAEGMIRGFRPIGNEINIIGGNFYATQEGLDRKVSEFPGLTNLTLTPSVPVLKDGGALVAYEASWMINGKVDRLKCTLVKGEDGEPIDRRIPVRVNAGQGADAILGKARRKMLARVYERISGRRLDEGDAIETTGELMRTEDPIPAPVEPEQDGRRIRMGKSSKTPPHDPETGEVTEAPMREPGED